MSQMFQHLVVRSIPLFSLLILKSTLSAQPLSFKDVAAERGLNFVHDHGGTDQKFYIETMGSGCCLLDYDNDNDLDVFFLQGAPLPGWKKEVTLRNQLFRNDEGQFSDVTGESGLGATSYGVGCAAADYDNDGDTDIYVTNFGDDILYRNEGDGTFADVTYISGISNPHWASSAAFREPTAIRTSSRASPTASSETTRTAPSATCRKRVTYPE